MGRIKPRESIFAIISATKMEVATTLMVARWRARSEAGSSSHVSRAMVPEVVRMRRMIRLSNEMCG